MKKTVTCLKKKYNFTFVLVESGQNTVPPSARPVTCLWNRKSSLKSLEEEHPRLNFSDFLSTLLAVSYLIRMSHWRHTMVNGPEFWISCKRPAFLSSFSPLQVIQNLAPSTIMWRQCDIGINKQFHPACLFRSARKYSINNKLLRHFFGRKVLCPDSRFFHQKFLQDFWSDQNSWTFFKNTWHPKYNCAIFNISLTHMHK